MINSLKKIKHYIYTESILIVLLSFLYVGIAYLLLKINNISELIYAFSLFPILVLFGWRFVKDFETFLIILTLLPFIYINSSFHSSLSIKIFSDVFLLLFIIFSIFFFVYKSKFIGVKVSPLLLLISLFFVYSIFSAINGISKGNQSYWVIDELYNHFYYLTSIPIYFLLRKRNNYKSLFAVIVFVSIIVSIEYIYLNINSSYRITSFQGSLFPISFSLSFSYFMLSSRRNKLKIVALIFSIIIVLGSIYIQTRAIWVAILISLSTILYMEYFLKIEKKWLKRTMIFTVIVGIILLLLVFMLHTNQRKTREFNVNNTERVESIASPTKDASFLMRVELGYYIFQRFLQHPVLGEGLGGKVNYKIFANVGVNYPDNSWLYFLWKDGIIGTTILILLYFVFMKQTLFIYNNTKIIETKIISLGILSGFSGIFFASLLSANLIKYGKILLIYAIILAYVEYEKRNIIDEKK